MPACTKSAVSSTPRPNRTSKGKARMTIKTATVPKFKSPHPFEIVCESPMHAPSPISRPVVTPVEDGELPLDEESLWEGLP